MTTKLPGVPDTTITDIIPAGAFSDIGIATAVPIISVRWFDERQHCKLAHLYDAGEIEGTPQQYQSCFFYQAGGGCVKNGKRAPAACLFHLNPSAPEWSKLREWALLVEPDGNIAVCRRDSAVEIAADLNATIIGAVKVEEPRE